MPDRQAKPARQNLAVPYKTEDGPTCLGVTCLCLPAPRNRRGGRNFGMGSTGWPNVFVAVSGWEESRPFSAWL